MEPIALTIAELPKYGGPRRDKAYKDIRAGRLIARKSGRNTVILVEDLKKYLSALPAIAPQGMSEAVQRGQPRGRVRRTTK